MRAFDEHGWEIVSGLFSAAEVATMQEETRRLYADSDLMSLDDERTISRKTISGGSRIDRFDPVSDVSPVFGSIARDDRLTQLAADLIGGPVLLFKDKLIFKAPGMFGYEVHQDFTAWQEAGVPPEDIVSLMVAIDPATKENGAIDFYPGLHRRHVVDRPFDTDVFSQTGCVVDEAELAGVAPVTAEAQAGDLIAIHSLVPHCSSPNRSTVPRAAVFFTYSHTRHGDRYDHYYELFRNYRKRSDSIAADR